MTEFFDFAGDPFAGDAVPEYYHIQSDEYGGDYDDLTAPASPNFPVGTPTRYFLSLPQVPYTGDYSTYPMSVKDVTSGVTLTRVTASPAANEYRVATAGSKAAQVIELHSGQAGHVIGFDYYGFGSVIDERAANTFSNTLQFCARKTANQTLSTINTIILFQNEIYDIDDVYNSTTGVFTAKLSGLYRFKVNFSLHDIDPALHQFYFSVNSATATTGTVGFEIGYLDASGQNIVHYVEQIIELTAGDTVSFRFYNTVVVGGGSPVIYGTAYNGLLHTAEFSADLIKTTY